MELTEVVGVVSMHEQPLPIHPPCRALEEHLYHADDKLSRLFNKLVVVTVSVDVWVFQWVYQYVFVHFVYFVLV